MRFGFPDDRMPGPILVRVCKEAASASGEEER
jgi:hypothetical protein